MNNTITIDPALDGVADNYLSRLEKAATTLADTEGKLAKAKDKLDGLTDRLSSGDSSVTVPELTSAKTSVERFELLANAATRQHALLANRPQVSPVGVAQVLAETLSDLYPVPVTITANKHFVPDELPHLVIVVPSSSTSQGWASVRVDKIDLVLHRRSGLERHREADRIVKALEAIGWRLRVRSEDDGYGDDPQTTTLQVLAGFEAIPDVCGDGTMKKGFEVGTALALAQGSRPQLDIYTPARELIVNGRTVSVGYDTHVLGSQVEDGVRTTAVAVRIAGFEAGKSIDGKFPTLKDAGDLQASAALLPSLAQLAGLLPEGRIVSVEPVKGTPTWASRMKPLEGVKTGGRTNQGVSGIAPVTAAFALVTCVAKATEEEPQDAHAEAVSDEETSDEVMEQPMTAAEIRTARRDAMKDHPGYHDHR